MKFRTLASFDRDLARLPKEHPQAFLNILRKHFLPAVADGGFSGDPPWPTRLRVHRLAETAIYSITWSFTSPDGRATFHLDTADDGSSVLVWRRIGNHEIYRRPLSTAGQKRGGSA